MSDDGGKVMTINHMTLWVRWQKEFFIKWWDKKFKINKHNFSTTLICSTNKSHIYTRVRDYYMTFSISALVLARYSHTSPTAKLEGWYGSRLLPGTIWKISCHNLFITYFTLTFSKHWLLYCKKDLWTDKLWK